MKQLNSPTSKYFMPTCLHCKRKYKVSKEKVMRVSFRILQNDGSSKRETYYSVSGFCPKCKKRMEEIGPAAMLNEHLADK